MSWLSDKLKELEAQVNPFDGGKTASTVRSARKKAPPAQTGRTAAQNRDAQNLNRAYKEGRVNREQYGQQLRAIKGKTEAPKQNFFERNVFDRFSGNSALDQFKRNQDFDRTQRRTESNIRQNMPIGFKPSVYQDVVNNTLDERRGRFNELQNQSTNPFRDILDANTSSDRLKRHNTFQPELYRDQQTAMGIRARNNIGEQIVAAPTRLLNTYKAGLEGAAGLAAIGSASVLGNDEDYKRVLENTEQRLNQSLQPTSGLLGHGTMFNSPEEARDISAADLTKRIGAYGLENASMLYGGAGIGSLLKIAAAKGLSKAATRKLVAAELAKQSGAGFGGGVGEELGSNKYATPQSMLLAGATSALTDPLLGVGAYGAGRLGRGVVDIASSPQAKQIKNKAKLAPNKEQVAKLTEQKASNNQKIAEKLPLLDTAKLRGKTASARNIENEIKALEKANAAIDAEIKGTGGFIRVPGSSEGDGTLNNKGMANEAANPVDSQQNMQSPQDASSSNRLPQADYLSKEQSESLGGQTPRPIQTTNTQGVAQAEYQAANLQGQNQASLQGGGKEISSYLDNTPNTPSSQEMGSLLLATDQDPSQFNPDFNAVSTGDKKGNNKLVTAMKNDQDVTNAMREASQSGKQIDFYAEKDANGRSVGIKRFDPRIHRIEAGFVVDQAENVLGNHIQVDETGMQVNVGGELINMDSIIGSPDQWHGDYRISETMDRNLQRIAPTEKIYRTARRFLIDHKIKNEAIFRKELRSMRDDLNRRVKSVKKAKPSGVSKKQYQEDIFDYIEGNKTEAEMGAKYGDMAAINQYKNDTRVLYDTLLERVNTEFAKYGENQVPRRENYLTHINELMTDTSFMGEMRGRLENSFTGDGLQTTRKGVPSEIAGRTEGFQPRKRFNKYFQERKGGEFTKDPFKAVDSYIEPTLYNIHMTSSTVRARAIESAFRTASQIKSMDKTGLDSELQKSLKNYQGGDNEKLVTGFQEYANALAGKTQRFDRQIVDASKGTEAALRGWQGLQRVGGRATILGNASSVISQTLNQPLALADAGLGNYIKGVGSTIAKNTPIDKSPFITARSTQVDSKFRGNFDKTMDIMGVPLQAVELASVKQTWNAEYHKAKSDGFTGQEAILEADRRTEQVVAGRGIADKPEMYRSTAINGLLQYTLEVSAQNKKFWQDLNTVQKAEYIVAAFAANSLVGLITGYEPLPDYLGAAIDSMSEFNDEEDERSGAEKGIGALQRFGSETVSMNPVFSSLANTLTSQDQRKWLFGEDSDLGRFEGTAAPIQVMKNLARAGKSANEAFQTDKDGNPQYEGRIQDARNSLLRSLVPGGNQARKTITGIEANNRGYGINKAGDPTFGVSDDPIRRAQAILFGANATPSAKNYYDNNMSAITGKKDMAEIRAAEEAGQTDVNKVVDNIQERRLLEREQKAAKDKAKASGEPIEAPTSDPLELLRDEYSPAKREDTRETYGDETVDNAIKQAGESLNEELASQGLPGVETDEELAYEYAKFKNRIDGKNEIEVAEQTRNFYRDTYKSQMDDKTQSFYKLSDDEMRESIQAGQMTKDQVDKAIEIDNLLTNMGIQKYPQIGKTLRRELGYGIPKGSVSGGSGGSGGSRGGSKSKKGKYDYGNIIGFSGTTNPISLTDKLLALLNNTTSV